MLNHRLLFKMNITCGYEHVQVYPQMHTVAKRLPTLRFQSISGRRDGLLGLMDVIALARSSKATDPRDKVFGLLVLLPRDIYEQVLSKVTYDPSFSARVAYVMFTKVCISSKHGLNTLARVNCVTRPPSPLPSWVINLNLEVMEDVDHTIPLGRENAMPSGDWDARRRPALQNLHVRFGNNSKVRASLNVRN